MMNSQVSNSELDKFLNFPFERPIRLIQFNGKHIWKLEMVGEYAYLQER